MVTGQLADMPTGGLPTRRMGWASHGYWLCGHKI